MFIPKISLNNPQAQIDFGRKWNGNNKSAQRQKTFRELKQACQNDPKLMGKIRKLISDLPYIPAQQLAKRIDKLKLKAAKLTQPPKAKKPTKPFIRYAQQVAERIASFYNEPI